MAEYCEPPTCTCGSRSCGLIFIPNENRYQCGDCVIAAYAKLAELKHLAAAHPGGEES